MRVAVLPEGCPQGASFPCDRVPYERQHQPEPKIDPWQVELDALLDGNDSNPKRGRLSLVRMYEDLRRLGYDGSYDAVPRYAKSRDCARGAAMAEAYVPLFFETFSACGS